MNLFDWKTWISGITARSTGGSGWFGHCDYIAGDDLRAIDWALCARHDELRVRQSTGPVDTRLYFLFDCSRSMAFGTPSKFDAGRRTVAELADAALNEGSQVRISAFADGLVADSEPARGKMTGDRLTRFLAALHTERAPTDLAKAATAWVRRNQRRGPVVVTSDLCEPAGFQQGVGILRDHGYPVGILHIYDPGEATPDVLGEAELVDAETGISLEAVVTERHLKEHRRLFAAFLEGVRKFCARRGLVCLQIPTHPVCQSRRPGPIARSRQTK
jgi:uncharacterized protein (DUF58 family)